MIKGITFKNANEAFAFFKTEILVFGERRKNTVRLKNVSFTILNPLDNLITDKSRKWSKRYADRELEWYKSENRSVEEIKKYAPIWDSMHNGDNIVNSNYGYQLNRNGQLDRIVNTLTTDKNSRQAWVTIYDGKEWEEHSKDTPCTLNLGFDISNTNKLDMTVLMRSNDLWYGFCNDQYCFSNYQKEIADSLELEVGVYHHFASDLHLYDDQVEIVKQELLKFK